MVLCALEICYSLDPEELQSSFPFCPELLVSAAAPSVEAATTYRWPVSIVAADQEVKDSDYSSSISDY